MNEMESFMENIELKKIIQEALNDHDLGLDAIPDLDLYMDQIISLINYSLEGNKRDPEDKLVTKTMINNYTKEGLLPPAKGKKYTMEHMLRLLIVLSMKNTLSLGDIKVVMQNLSETEHYNVESLKDTYTNYLMLKNQIRTSVEKSIFTLIDIENLDAAQKEDLLLLLLGFTSMADEMKRIAEKMIDTYFKGDI